ELCQVLHLKPGVTSYEVTVTPREIFPGASVEEVTTINLTPRSTTQAFFFLAHGIVVPLDHLDAGIIKPTVWPDGSVFDWQEVSAGLFTVHSCKQHRRPKEAWVAGR